MLGSARTSGDMDAAVALLPRLRRMAVRMALIYGRPDFAADLCQEAALAVLQAPGTWNVGAAMVTAANAMRDTVRQLAPVSASPSSLYRYGQVRHATAMLWRVLQRRPSDAEVAAELHMRPSTVRSLREAFESETVSPFTVTEEGDVQERLQHPGASPEDMLQASELRHDVARGVARLAPVQAQTIVLRFGFDRDDAHGVGSLAEHRGVTRSSVNVSLQHAIPVLRRALHGWAP